MPKTLRLIAGCLIVVALALVVFSQTSTQLPELDKNGKPVFPRPSPHISYSPADLSHGGITLPASAATPNTSIIKTGAATKMTLFVNCTQAVNLSVNVYTADDQSSSSPNWTLYGTYTLVTGIAAGAHQVYIATELAPKSPLHEELMSRFSQAVITAFLLVAVCSAQNWTTVSAANITDLNQNKLASGQLCFLGTDQNDNPISFNVGGGGQVLRRAFCAQVAAGAVTAFTVPNPVNTTPAGVLYRVTVKDSSTGQEVLRYTQVTFSGGAFNFDAYAPVSIGSFAPPTGTATPGNLTVNGNLNVTGSLTGAVLGFSNLSGTIGANQNSTALNAQSGTSYTMLDSDRGKLVTLNNASAVSVSLPQAGAGSQFVAGWYARVESQGAGVVTITPATSTIDGAASLTLRQFGGVVIVSDGANYFTVRGRVVSAADLSNGTTGTSGSPVVLATSPALTTPNIGAATGASLDLSGGNIQSSALVSTRNNVGNNQVEFGHPNPAGYGSNLGYESSSGQPFFCFACQAGSTTNTYRTRGLVGRIIKYDIGASSLDFGRVANLNADNQSVTIDMLIDSSGNLKIQGAQYVQPGSTPFSGLPSAPNGSIIYCSDCNSTCTAGSSTGRTCFRENGTWTH